MIEINSHDTTALIYFQRKWIDTLSDISIRPVWIAKTWGDGIPGHRLPISQYHWMFPYQYRECLHNELPYDLDVQDYEVLKVILQPTLDFLDNEGIPYLMSGSGGSKSVHVQIWFTPTIECILYGWRHVRMGLWNWILDCAEVPEEMRGDGKLGEHVYSYDCSVCNFGDMVQGKVMRDFCGRGKEVKTLIVGELPETREEIYQGKTVVPDEIRLWNPSKALGELEFKTRGPYSCGECPVYMEWVLFREDCGDKRYQYPSLCRRCGRVYEVN